MKTIATLSTVLCCAYGFALGAPVAPNRSALEEKIVSLFEVSNLAALGTNAADEELLKRMVARGGRDEIVRYVMTRAHSLGLGVSVFYYGSLFFSWQEADEEGRIIEIRLQIVLNELQRPVKVVSVVRRGKPPQKMIEMPIVETPLDLPTPP